MPNEYCLKYPFEYICGDFPGWIHRYERVGKMFVTYFCKKVFTMIIQSGNPFFRVA